MRYFLLFMLFSIYAFSYPKYIETTSDDQSMYYFPPTYDKHKITSDFKAILGKGDNYLRPKYEKHIDKTRVKSLLEIGSRDALDAICLSDYYKCHVFAFECNPKAIDICKKNISCCKNKNVTLIPYALWDKSGTIPFYAIDEYERNIGASSCFKFVKDETVKKCNPKEIQVEAIRLDVWLNKNKIKSIDMICMDAQGAAFEILKGMGKYLSKVKYIVVELENWPVYYAGEVLADEVIKFLEENGFEYKKGSKVVGFDDFLFVNKNLI